MKGIENDITLSETKPKKKTLNDLKENKKTVDDDINIIYTIYVRYKVWFIIDNPSEKDNYKLFIDELGYEIHTEWIFRLP